MKSYFDDWLTLKYKSLEMYNHGTHGIMEFFVVSLWFISKLKVTFNCR